MFYDDRSQFRVAAQHQELITLGLDFQLLTVPECEQQRRGVSFFVFTKIDASNRSRWHHAVNWLVEIEQN